MDPSERSRYMSEEEVMEEFQKNLTVVATLQGRLAYMLMSIHVVNPYLWEYLSVQEPGGVLFANMLYGMGVFIYTRTCMRPIATFNRMSFSILGSMMFNYSSMQVFAYLGERLNVLERPFLTTFLSYLAGRIMLVHFLAFWYHVETRINLHSMRAAPYEQMYRM